jgi:hypothetical protein
MVATRSVSGWFLLPAICIRRFATVNYVLISMKPFAELDQTVRGEGCPKAVRTDHAEPSAFRVRFTALRLRSIDRHLNLQGREPDTPSRSAVFAVALRSLRAARRSRLFGSTMLVVRYFAFVGGALLAVLVGLSSFLPEPEMVARADAPRPVIRIKSDRVVPPRIDFDTRVQIAMVPAPVPEILPQAPVRVADAQVSAPPRAPVLPAKIERKKTRIAKRPDRQRMAANPQGFPAFHLTW